MVPREVAEMNQTSDFDFRPQTSDLDLRFWVSGLKSKSDP